MSLSCIAGGWLAFEERGRSRYHEKNEIGMFIPSCLFLYDVILVEAEVKHRVLKAGTEMSRIVNAGGRWRTLLAISL